MPMFVGKSNYTQAVIKPNASTKEANNVAARNPSTNATRLNQPRAPHDAYWDHKPLGF